MSKSHVAMEQHQCPICLTRFDTGNILLSTRMYKGQLLKTLDDHQLTGHSPCKECQTRLNKGYIALIEITDAQPAYADGTTCLQTPRSGNVAWVHESAFANIFDVPVPPQKICFIEPGVIEKLCEIQQQSEQQPD